MNFEEDIKIVLTQEILEDLKKCVDNARPNEACGLIFGDIKEVNKNGDDYQYHYIAKRFNCIEGEVSPVSFLMNDVEKLNEIFQDASQQNKMRLISIFHSHPAGAFPSGVDSSNMKFLDTCGNKAFKNQIWTIMSATNYELNGFIYLKEELMQIAVETEKK